MLAGQQQRPKLGELHDVSHVYEQVVKDAPRRCHLLLMRAHHFGLPLERRNFYYLLQKWQALWKLTAPEPLELLRPDP